MIATPQLSTNTAAMEPDTFPIASRPETVAPTESTGNPSAGFEWGTIIWITLLHVGAVAALFCFTWVGALTAFVLFWMTGSLGICMGYHRLFAHRSFKTFAVVRWGLAIIGTLGGEGSPLFWVAAHRKHHKFSDEDEDPHGPTPTLSSRFNATPRTCSKNRSTDSCTPPSSSGTSSSASAYSP
jgi:fatty-acid desaturase